MHDEETLLQAMDNYFKNTPKEQILIDMIEAAGGEDRFLEVFEEVKESE